MVTLYVLLLVGIFLSMACIWGARTDMAAEDYTDLNSHFQKAIQNECIINRSWSTVLHTFNEKTTFPEGFSSDLGWGLVALVFIFIMGVLFGIYACMNLTKSRGIARQLGDREFDY